MSIDDVISARITQQRHRDLVNWWNSVPDKLRHYDMDSLLESNWDGKISPVAKKSITDYLNNPSSFLILHGGSGLGKSLMGVEICGKLLSSGKARTAMFADCPTFLDQLSFRYSDVDPIGHLSSPDILMLDDVGAGTSELSATRKNGMWSLINRRWQSGKRTVMTTNMPITVKGVHNVEEGVLGLSEWFGESSWDRITDGLVLVGFRGQSARRAPHGGMARKATDTPRR